MAKYRYLGYGTTDSNGIAKLDHDDTGSSIAHSYTGTGAGEIDVVASLDEEIVEGSIVSEIYEVWDYIKHDINNTLAVTDYNVLYPSDTLSIVDDHKEFTTIQSSGRRCYLPFNAPSDFRIELEVKFTNMGNIGVWNSTDNGKYKQNENNTDWLYYRINKISNSVTIQKSTDGDNWVGVTVSNYGTFDFSASEYRLLLTTISGTVYFRNIKIYPV